MNKWSCKSFLITEFSFSVKGLALIFFSLFQRVCLWFVKFEQWRKEWTVDSISFPQVHKGSILSWKLCLNLCSFKWQKPTLRRVRSFSPNGSLMLKTLVEFGLMKFNKCFLKISKEVILLLGIKLNKYGSDLCLSIFVEKA